MAKKKYTETELQKELNQQRKGFLDDVFFFTLIAILIIFAASCTAYVETHKEEPTYEYVIQGINGTTYCYKQKGWETTYVCDDGYKYNSKANWEIAKINYPKEKIDEPCRV